MIIRVEIGYLGFPRLIRSGRGRVSQEYWVLSADYVLSQW
jgi:hypothetical protein